jgi:hypothetical protein
MNGRLDAKFHIGSLPID